MSKDNSDYSKPRINLYDKLPNVHKSKTNKSLLENVFNRFLTKSETQFTSGFIGQGNRNAALNRQVQEPTAHRQAFQLQPILYNKIGSVERITSWEDVLNELYRQGIDTTKYKQWGNPVHFNWVPPIDIDKLLHYQDYFWYDPENPTSTPQYLTIRNRCSAAVAKVNFYEALVAQYGSEFSITGLSATNNTITISDNLSNLFVEGFVFFVKNSINTDLNAGYHTTVSSEYISSNNTTIITIDQNFVDESLGIYDIISLTEQLTILRIDRDSLCHNSIGWDNVLWDDNSELEGDWPNIDGSPGIPTIQPVSPSVSDLWYDTVEDELKQWNGLLWITIQRFFSQILVQTEGQYLWDSDDGHSLFGGNSTYIHNSGDQWANQNKWIHLNDVPNFSIAKRARMPIIEYLPNLEINEWYKFNYNWLYAVDQNVSFIATTIKPNLFEIQQLVDFTLDGNDIIFDSKYGDLSNIFTEGFVFTATNTSNTSYTVDTSIYEKITELSPFVIKYQTRVTLTDSTGLYDSTGSSPSPSANLITIPQPLLTSQGDQFKGYNIHWLLDVSRDFDTVPVNHQPENKISNLDDLDWVITPSLAYRITGQAQQWTSTLSEDTFVLDDQTLSGYNLQRLALAETETIRVYIDGQRQYKNYTETTEPGLNIISILSNTVTVNGDASSCFSTGNTARIENAKWSLPSSTSTFIVASVTYNSGVDTTTIELTGLPGSYQVGGQIFNETLDISSCADFSYVIGIVLDAAVEPGTLVEVQVGASAQSDLGWNIISTITTDSNEIPITMNLSTYRKAEQLKTETNQNPLFDLYDIEGTPLNAVGKIFSFLESSDYPQYAGTGIRVVRTGTEFSFEQDLIEVDNGAMSTYKDYDLGVVNDAFIEYWFNPINNTLKYYDPAATSYSHPVIWADSWDINDVVRTPVVSEEEPAVVYDRLHWVDPTTCILKIWNDSPGEWVEDTNVIISDSDPLIRTIWRKGLNNETYIPEYVDRNRDPITIGDTEGQWEIPDPLYFNNQHENRKIITSTQLVAHFNSIIDNQPRIPGYPGSSRTMFHILNHTEVNYGLGGTIKEYNDGFDTLLSATYIDSVTPISVIEFARDQYDGALLQLIETYRNDFVNYMTDVNSSSFVNTENYIADQVIQTYELNDRNSSVYYDTTTFNDTTDAGVRNWIITTPYLGTNACQESYVLRDDNIDLNEVVHHDGHREQYSIPEATLKGLISELINTNDITSGEKWGYQSQNTPPLTIAGFPSGFSARPGVYWYDISTNPSTLYRLNIKAITNFSQSVTLPEGSKWFHITNSELRELQSGVWNIIGSDLTLGWEEIDIQDVLSNIINDVETRLCGTAPVYKSLSFDIDQLQTDYPSEFLALEEIQFLNYVNIKNVDLPFANINYEITDAFTWNYKQSPIGSGNYPSSSNLGTETGSDWRDLYEKLYNTPYPHLEPWKLQGYITKPTWWDSEYLFVGSPTNFRRWEPIMWTNILSGTIPSPYELPLNIIPPTYQYVSVNISDSTVLGYDPDSVLPPYFSPPLSPAISPSIRSVYTSINDIINPELDYTFGDAGPIEWEWRQSIEYVYDRLIIAYKMQPVRFLFNTFGVDTILVDGLEIDNRTDNTFSHTRTTWHGDLLNDTEVFYTNGINQWYVNYNRYYGYDKNYSDFGKNWTEWTAPLSYQMASFIDTDSLDIDNTNIYLSNNDNSIVIKKSPGVDDFWLDSFKISLQYVPPELLRYDNQNEWAFQVSTYSSISRSIPYYGVKNLQFYVTGLLESPPSSVCSLFTYPITNVDLDNNTITVNGNQTNTLERDGTFEIYNSTSLDGTWTIVDSIFNSASNETVLRVQELISTIITSPFLVDGLLKANSRSLFWETGDIIRISSEQTLPVPLQNDLEYFIIKYTDDTFAIANTFADALVDNPIVLTSQGTGSHFIGEVISEFKIFNGGTEFNNSLWINYAIDTNKISILNSPQIVYGIQGLINFIQGYGEYIKNDHWRVNKEKTYVDEDTVRVVNWQIELERFIDWAYLQQRIKYKNKDKYTVNVNTSTDVWTFTSQVGDFITGDPINITSDSIIPHPLVKGGRYFMIRDSVSNFRLAATNRDALNSVAIDIINPGSYTLMEIDYVDNAFVISGNYTTLFNSMRRIILVNTVDELTNLDWTIRSTYYDEDNNQTEIRVHQTIPSIVSSPLIGDVSYEYDGLYITTGKTIKQRRPTFELNAFRNGIWFSQPYGIVSDTKYGPFDDIRTSQLLIDQYGRNLNSNNVIVYREDNLTEIKILNEIANTVDLTASNYPYDYIHLAGVHLFIDTYEHMIKFNNYSTDGCLIYDPFLGLNLSSFNVEFLRNPEFTQRPNLGGFFLNKTFNQGGTMIRNIEASIDDMRKYYDTYTVSESRDIMKQSRSLLDYPGSIDYFDRINISKKSQFLFYKSMIHHKGTKTPIDALLNTRSFVSATVDEYWAVKVADFGSAAEREYPQLKLTTEDAKRKDLRLQFASIEDLVNNVTPDTGFELITLDEADQDRWHLYPDQVETLRNNNITMYFDMKAIDKFDIILPGEAEPISPSIGDSIIRYTSPDYTFERWNGTEWINHGSWLANETPIIRHNFSSDAVAIYIRQYQVGYNIVRDITSSPSPLVPEWTSPSAGSPDYLNIDPYFYGTGSLRVFQNGKLIEEGVEWNEVATSGTFANQISLQSFNYGDQIQVFYTTGRLVEGVHFDIVNSRIITLSDNALLNVNSFSVWGLSIDKDSQHPATIIDTQSNVVIQNVTIWDPARGNDYYVAKHLIDLEIPNDPATYSNSVDTSIVTTSYWSKPEVGTIWLDSYTKQYEPYHDKSVIPDIEQRLLKWGNLAEWGDFNIYQWTESNVPPSEWNALAEIESGDITIDESIRKSGTVRQVLLENINDVWVPLKIKHETVDPLIDGLYVAANTYDFILQDTQDIETFNIVASSIDDNTFTLEGDASLIIIAGDTITIEGAPTESPIPSPILNNNGNWTVTESSYDGTNTIITVSEFVQTDLAGGTITANERIDVYVNGILIESSVSPMVDTLASPILVTIEVTDINDNDSITFVRPLPSESIIASRIEDGSYQYDTPYAQVDTIDILNNIQSKFYFWVENKTTRARKVMSIEQATQYLKVFPGSYMIFDKPVVSQVVNDTTTNQVITIPDRFEQIIIRGIRGLIGADNRYVIRFTRDFTLRDILETNSTRRLKSLHSEWKLIRELQADKISSDLWNKITESIVGYKLTDSSIRVPLLQRELYDIANDTDTRYGLGNGQAFVNGEQALATVLTYIQDPTIDFLPIDIDTFFELYSFDTNEDIILSMNTIYNTFNKTDVNKIFFLVLHDALSNKTKYNDIIKTSLIALSGVQVLDNNGQLNS